MSGASEAGRVLENNILHFCMEIGSEAEQIYFGIEWNNS